MEDSELIRPGNWEGGGGLGVSADNAIVRNNLIRDSWSVGIDNSSSNSLFSGNTIENSYEGIASAFGHPENVIVTDNIIRNVIKRGIFLEGLRNATVTGNTVENCWGEPVEVSTESNVQANTFTSNTFVNYRNHPFSEGNNIWHDDQKGNGWRMRFHQAPDFNPQAPGWWVGISCSPTPTLALDLRRIVENFIRRHPAAFGVVFEKSLYGGDVLPVNVTRRQRTRTIETDRPQLAGEIPQLWIADTVDRRSPPHLRQLRTVVVQQIESRCHGRLSS